MKQKLSSAVLAAVSLGLMLVATVLQAIAVATVYDPDANYFLAETALPTVAVTLGIAGAILGTASACLFGKGEEGATPFSDKLYPALPLALGAIAGAILLLLSSQGTLGTLAAILLLGAAIYTLLAEASIRDTAPATVALLGFLPVVACAILTAYYYFDTSIEMNAPFKVLLQTALLFAMLYFTGELRFLLDRKHPRLYLSLGACTLAASLLCASAILPAFLLGATDRMDYLAGAVAALGIAITVIFRMLHFIIPAKTDSVDLPVEPTEALADEQEEHPE